MDPTLLIASLMVASTPILLAALGELVVEKSGVLNLGVERHDDRRRDLRVRDGGGDRITGAGVHRGGGGRGALVANLRTSDPDPPGEPGRDGPLR